MVLTPFCEGFPPVGHWLMNGFTPVVVFFTTECRVFTLVTKTGPYSVKDWPTIGITPYCESNHTRSGGSHQVSTLALEIKCISYPEVAHWGGAFTSVAEFMVPGGQFFTLKKKPMSYQGFNGVWFHSCLAVLDTERRCSHTNLANSIFVPSWSDSRDKGLLFGCEHMRQAGFTVTWY